MSPECLRGEYYSSPSDVFSFGIILCEIIGRVEADPDILPRSPDFGLDIEAFSALCSDCPSEILNVATQCCQVSNKS